MAFYKDLIVLVPDGAICTVVETLLENRRSSLGIRDISFKVIKDPMHDSSPQSKAVELLRGFLRTDQRAIVLRDLSGSGWENGSALEQTLMESLAANGWKRENICAIAIVPELEIWLRIGSIHVQQLVQERARRNVKCSPSQFTQFVRDIVQRLGGETHDGKPRQPKECFEAILEYFGIPRSNALYCILAKKESLTSCIVPSFQKFLGTLKNWFPAT